MPISVLYIHHVGAFSGSSRSLFELIKAFPAGAVDAHVVVQQGPVVAVFEELGIPVIASRGVAQFDNTEHSHYRGARWLLLIREAFYAIFTFAALWKAKRRWKNIDVIHVNEITAMPTIVMAKLLFRSPIVVHVRSMQETVAASFRRGLVYKLLEACASAVIAIDETVRRTLPAGLRTFTIHNGFEPMPVTEPDTRLHGDVTFRFTVAMVGSLLPVKGIFEFIDAARICAQRELPIQFVLVGSPVRSMSGWKKVVLGRLRFSTDVLADLQSRIRAFGLTDRVHLLGFERDIGKIYAGIEVVCFPSHLNAVGRPVFEAAFYGVPSIVAIVDPLPDTVAPGVTGLCIPMKDSLALADAIEFFYKHPLDRERMGAAAKDLAHKLFDIRSNANRVLQLYGELLGT